MRRLALALTLIARPALAADVQFVGYAPDAPTLKAAFQSLGFWNASASSPIIAGIIPDDSGPFFMNVVGAVQEPTGQMTTCLDPGGKAMSCPAMAPITGYWFRLRMVGNDPFASGSMTIPAGLTVYSWQATLNNGSGCWANKATPSVCAATPTEPATSAQIDAIGRIF